MTQLKIPRACIYLYSEILTPLSWIEKRKKKASILKYRPRFVNKPVLICFDCVFGIMKKKKINWREPEDFK
jgi:hypothetical protein